MTTPQQLHTSHDASCEEADDIVSFVVEDGAHTLYFSKRRLMRHTPFFKAYFTAHAAASNSDAVGINNNTVVLKHVTGAAAEAALRLCHSNQHGDDGPFWALQTACTEATTTSAVQRRDALRHLLSLYEACVKFELLRHAHVVGDALAAAVTTATVLDVLKTCARYTSALPLGVRAKIGLRGVLAACRACLPSAWACNRDEKRWRRLCSQYPELPAMLEVEAAAATAEQSTDTAVVERSGLRQALLSPQRDGAVKATIESTADHRGGSNETVRSPLEDVFAHHLRQTEALALEAQIRRREMEADVAALRAGGAALRDRVREDEDAAAESTRYLSDARVYVQALCAAETDMRALRTALVPASSAMHALRHELERAAERAEERRSAVDELLAAEEDALRDLDDELAKLRSADC
ncbi:hypothetical protein ABB37_06246 [Leptomonas pyrrhocoris]|uniref:BTB domain-containing protein n=1 Tax=Leptomonas pyrrhocoris TaxID=157538 RepID=A0A0M9FYT0_LEPPY|nr:hypothetical protein ABB37_06246 [Leptomonas pyrrhocoris]KPA78646.1 hypothetical protein ABB37_06246 [Leptomonas pyrrhocoris]|eukprot:XP_015657085.1 hypothetical protein ABB37_06246 [Leptomonas pyrrhocoris]